LDEGGGGAGRVFALTRLLLYPVFASATKPSPVMGRREGGAAITKFTSPRCKQRLDVSICAFVRGVGKCRIRNLISLCPSPAGYRLPSRRPHLTLRPFRSTPLATSAGYVLCVVPYVPPKCRYIVWLTNTKFLILPVIPFLAFAPEIRKIIYTTNAIDEKAHTQNSLHTHFFEEQGLDSSCRSLHRPIVGLHRSIVRFDSPYRSLHWSIVGLHQSIVSLNSSHRSLHRPILGLHQLIGGLHQTIIGLHRVIVSLQSADVDHHLIGAGVLSLSSDRCCGQIFV